MFVEWFGFEKGGKLSLAQLLEHLTEANTRDIERIRFKSIIDLEVKSYPRHIQMKMWN